MNVDYSRKRNELIRSNQRNSNVDFFGSSFGGRVKKKPERKRKKNKKKKKELWNK